MSDSPSQNYNFGRNANVHMLEGLDAYGALLQDIRGETPIHAWVYLLEPEFFKTLFHAHLATKKLNLIVDNRQQPIVRDLLAIYPNLSAASHSTNRTMHDKTILFPALGVSWIGSYNVTRGSWSMSQNRAARVKSFSLCDELMDAWNTMLHHCKILRPPQLPGHTTPPSDKNPS